MTEKKEAKEPAKRDPADRLARLKKQQADLTAQIRAQEQKLRDREEKKLNDRRIEIGKLAEAAGVLFAPDADLSAALKSIAQNPSSGA